MTDSPISLVGFDLETTSTEVATTTPTQACLVLRQGTADYVLLNTLVNPGQHIDEEASRITGITNAMVANATGYPQVAEYIQRLVEYYRPQYVVGYNIIQFDLPIIDRCCGSEVFKGTVPIDVLNAAMRYFPTCPSFKLGDMYHQFVGKPLEGAHDASADVVGCIELLFAMLPYVQASLSDVATDLQTPRPYSRLPIGKYKGTPLKNIPKSWAKWMAVNATDMRPDLKATVDCVLRM